MNENLSAANAALENEDAVVVHIASRANRLLNLVIDMPLCVVAGLAALMAAAHLPGLAWLEPHQLLADVRSTQTQLILAGMTLPYYFVFEYYLGKTPGKYLTRTRVVRAEDGEPPRAWQILLRTLLRHMPLEFMWYILAPSGPHDFMSQTVVVEEESPAEVEN